MTMKEIAENYEGPRKYLTQRDAPLEIPIDVIKRLFVAMDQDLDDKVSLDELIKYIKDNEVAISVSTAIDMFNDAASVRRVVLKKQYQNPLEIEEVQYAVRGRYQWNNDSKSWGIHYKQYRDYWLLLLLTVNDRLFSLQVPKVIPGKIRSQYEE